MPTAWFKHDTTKVRLRDGKVALSGDCCTCCPPPYGCTDPTADNYDPSAQFPMGSGCNYTQQLVAEATVDLEFSGNAECVTGGHTYGFEINGSASQTVPLAIYITRTDFYSDVDCPPGIYSTEYYGSSFTLVGLEGADGTGECSGGGGGSGSWSVEPQEIRIEYNGGNSWSVRVGDPITLSVGNECFPFADCGGYEVAFGPVEDEIASVDLAGAHTYHFEADPSPSEHYEMDVTLTLSAPAP